VYCGIAGSPRTPPQYARCERSPTNAKAAERAFGALLYRARTLGVIGESAYRRAMARMSSEGWRRDEPGDLGAAEAPTMLQEALELLRLHGVTLERLAAEARLPLAVVAEIVGSETRPRLHLADHDDAPASAFAGAST
jgi:hypothetical protein